MIIILSDKETKSLADNIKAFKEGKPQADGIQILGRLDECKECKSVKGIYNHDLCEECYGKLFEEEKK